MHSEVNEIRNKRLNSPWPKYLRSVTLSGLRGWQGQEVRFEFPICAIVGENGSGKSTILKAAAAAYSNNKDPKAAFSLSDFFFDTAWEKVSNAEITYKVVQGGDERTFSVRKPSERWRLPSKRRPSREVIWQDISRVLPLDATAGYAAIAKRNSIEVSAETLDVTFSKYYSSILGRQYAKVRVATSDAGKNKSVGVVEQGGVEYSQYHQGAGEDATLDLMRILQDAPQTSLVIIDEIEASLHPRAQRRLIHFLLWLTRTKQIQVILSTHSSFILEELPEEARIFLSRGTSGIEVLYGVSPNYALSRIDALNKPDLYLFTEDKEAATLTTEILRHQRMDLNRVCPMPVGPANMVVALGRLASDNKLPINARGVLDADQAQSPGCILLPGTLPPERQVFADIQASALDSLSVRLALPRSDVANAISSAMTLTDHHEWIAAASAELHQSTSYLWTTMAQVWIAECVDASELARIGNDISSSLPTSA
ncbi:ATP-binding protein [Haloferula sp. BvORR071]|uniref:ATP-dependent nuclease n=1 Tax=Haloferula sp. BvORR071 TaxID=1396141 RepID=UPI00055522AB|nr:ATP-binding protein [Haloferula sp. BvORR071]